MAASHVSGPLISTNGFVGDVEGAVEAPTLTVSGAVIFSGLPTTDPEVAGQLYLDTGVLTVSEGPA